MSNTATWLIILIMALISFSIISGAFVAIGIGAALSKIITIVTMVVFRKELVSFYKKIIHGLSVAFA